MAMYTVHGLMYCMVDCRSDECSLLDSKPQNVRQQTYIVFESALLLLFTACNFCGHIGTDIKKVVIGTFLRIRQVCSSCGRQRIWESQPYVGTTPAGNILLSSAILFTGSLPSKALRIFEVLKCATITTSTYFRHQKKILHPATLNVWQNHQQLLITSFAVENKTLVLAGDGRADSPGHSAKYGCYTFVDLSCNQVIDFKLVQVCMCTWHVLSINSLK